MTTTQDESSETPSADDTVVVRRGFLSRHRKAVIALVTVVAVLMASVVTYALWAKWRVDQALADVHTEQVFSGIDPATRPPASPDGGMTFLITGTDVLSPVATTGTETGSAPPVGGTSTKLAAVGPGRADIIMLVHVNADRSKVSVVSIPRDSLVTIPSYVDAKGVTQPSEKRKINAAFSLGGGALLVRTVESLTHVRIDHFVFIDYDGLIKLIDAIGGVTVDNPYGTHDVFGNPQWNFPAGPLNLDGFHARVWVAQRKNLPRSDIDRARNSRLLMQAIGAKLASPAVLSNPVQLQQVLDLLTSVATVDETLTPGTMKSLALSMHGVNVGNVVMRTAPTIDKSTYHGEVVFNLDPSKTGCLWAAIANSDLASIDRCSQA